MFGPEGPTFLELARQGLSSTRRGYDLLAPKFDATPFRTPDAILEIAARELAKRGPFGDGLDLCCGTGAGLRVLGRACRGRVVGLDFSPGMLAQARRRPWVTSAMDLVEADALALPWTAAFDLVTCFGAFGHVPRRDEPRFARGVFDALRPAGTFAFVTFPMPRPLSTGWLFGRAYNAVAHLRNALIKPEFVMFYLTFTRDDARRVLEAAGFELELVEGLFPAPWRRAVLALARRPR